QGAVGAPRLAAVATHLETAAHAFESCFGGVVRIAVSDDRVTEHQLLGISRIDRESGSPPLTGAFITLTSKTPLDVALPAAPADVAKSGAAKPTHTTSINQVRRPPSSMSADPLALDHPTAQQTLPVTTQRVNPRSCRAAPRDAVGVGESRTLL